MIEVINIECYFKMFFICFFGECLFVMYWECEMEVKIGIELEIILCYNRELVYFLFGFCFCVC